jgi:hypothetical protein
MPINERRRRWNGINGKMNKKSGWAILREGGRERETALN